MSSLTTKDSLWFEQLLEMSGGWVLNFNDRTLRIFVLESVGIDIEDGIYVGVGSKAKRLRHFWKMENDFRTQKLLSDLISHWYDPKEVYGYEFSDDELRLYEKCKFIIEVLKGNSIVEDMDDFSSIDVLNSQSIQLLSKEIKEKIQGNEPELALDRLHTFSVRFFRELGKKHSLEFKKDDGLHTLLKNYREFIVGSGHIQSDMTIQILKLNTNVLNNFNFVRNNESFAHDNDVLNKIESKLICNHVISLLKFIDEVEEVFQKANIAMEKTPMW
ncbi:abortive infection family protein [Sporosarcina sp. SG10008]|uniref:abortive infection family protein n=1 Tax=Sporosarcina sp. SG10008 TaxID=3373103 RepID=UPI0037DCC63C